MTNAPSELMAPVVRFKKGDMVQDKATKVPYLHPVHSVEQGKNGAPGKVFLGSGGIYVSSNTVEYVKKT
jgi:hypothetical protein